jgi:MerR family transcriptional regulator/heat shock protein HspR
MKDILNTITISGAARHIGVCIDTLRIWERKGLINPSRSGKNRRYNTCDIKKLEQIKYFIREKRMNISAVKEILNMKKCWEIKNCSAEERHKCAVYLSETMV